MTSPTIAELYRVVWEHAPETPTHETNLINENWALRLMWKLKVVGWNYRDEEHIGRLLHCAEKRGVLRMVDGQLARGAEANLLEIERDD